MAALHQDKSLTPNQRDFILAIEPPKKKLTAIIIPYLIHALYLFAAVALIMNAMRPESVPKWAFNVGKFVPWYLTFVCVGITIAIWIGFLIFAFRAGDFKSQMEKKTVTDQEYIKFGMFLTAIIKPWRQTPFHSFMGTLALLNIILIIIGLIMNGYVFLPILLSIGEVAFLISRAIFKQGIIRAVQAYMPEIKGSDAVIDVTPRNRPADMGPDLTLQRYIQ